MAGNRFDLMEAGRLESRDGGTGKGALIRNGFAEVDAEQERWCWQRPALATGTAAPMTGGGMGLYIAGTDLYGMWGSGGTAGSQPVAYFWLRSTSTSTGTMTSFSVNAADLGGLFGYAVSTAVGTTTTGSLSVTSWKGFAVSQLVASTSAASVSFFGTVGTSVFGTLVLNTTTYKMSTGVYSTAAGQTTIDFNVGAWTGTGTKTGRFN